MTTAAIYTRISQDREGRALGVERQEEDCRALAARLGVEVAGVYCDNDISASTLSTKRRPDYDRMLAEVRAGRIGVVLAYSSSRLTRRVMQWGELIELHQETGVRIHFAKSNDPLDLTTARGRRRAWDDAARDAEYAEEISENVKRAKDQRSAAGLPNCGGRRPFGFERDGVTPRPAERELVRAACRDVLAGRPLAAVAREWTEATEPEDRATPGPWLASTVRQVLTNPRVAGMLPDERPAVWADEAAVDEATWRGVVALLSDPERRNPARVDTRLLTGIGLCGLCGAPLRGGTAKGHATYRCGAQRHLEVASEPVDAVVRKAVCVALAAWDIQPRSQGAGPSAADLAGQAAGVRARLDEVADMLADGEFTRPQAARATARLTEELGRLEAAMAAAVQTNALAGLPADEEGLLAVWDGADVHRRRAILEATLRANGGWRVTVRSGGRGVRVFDPETVQLEPVKFLNVVKPNPLRE